MVTLEELLRKGEKLKKVKKEPKESEIRDRYNLDALIEIAKRTLKDGEAYTYPHKEFAEVIGFNPVGKIRRSTDSGDIIEEEYNISLPNDLRAFIESRPIEDFDDTVRIRMSGSEVVVEPFKEYKKRLEKRRGRGFI